MPPKLIFFDIDGTIVNLKFGISKQIFEDVISEVISPLQKIKINFDFSGLTDLMILNKISETNGIDFGIIHSKIDQIWQRIYHEFAKVDFTKYLSICKGVKSFIERIAQMTDIYLALLTGNFKEVAYLKLGAVGLAGYFPVGAFGNEKINRVELFDLALERAKEYYQVNFSKANIFVVGDSKSDIETAKKNSARSIAVSTGRTSFEDLSSAQPDLLVNELSDYQRIIEFIQK